MNSTLISPVNSLYVDDLIVGVDSVEQGLNLYQKAKEIMTAGRFNLRKWNLNSAEFLNQIREVELQGLILKPATASNWHYYYNKTQSPKTQTPENWLSMHASK